MTAKKKLVREELEAAASAFLAAAASPAASDRLRDYGLQRVMAKARAAEEAKVPSTVRRAYRNPALLRHVLIVAMVALLVMLVSTTGVYAFSLDAQPGSTLYGTKIFFERARIALNTSGAGDIRLEMEFSERRMQELQNMTASGNQQGAERWLREYIRNIEDADILFEGMTVQDAEELAAQFQDMLDRQAGMMQGMRQGLQPELVESVEGAYLMCDQERARMRQRCGQPEPGGSEQEPGGKGQQGQGNCPRMEDTSTQSEATSSGGVDTTDYGTAPVQAGSSANNTASAPGGSAADGTTNPPADTTQPQGPSDGAGGQATGDIGYQGEGPHGGYMP
jgi:Domain of unknown function (DUF5667)